MASIVWSRNSVALPQVFHWNGLHWLHAERIGSLAKRFASAFVTAVVAVVALAFVGMSFGLRVPFLEHSPKNANALAVRPPVKPKIVAAPTKDTCSSAQTQTNTLFASCPTFAVDYSAQQKGSINTNQFNVYSGPPVANKEVEYYTDNPGNIRVENGALVLQAQNQSDNGYKYTSARIDTQGKEDFLYGKLVIRATMPTGIGTWPAIWMLPSQPKYASLSPASDKSRYLNDGEIDIAESIGLQPNVVYGVAHSVAYPEDGPDHAYYNTTTVPGNDTTFHDYEIDWTPTTLTFSIDGAPYLTYTKQAGADWHSWPFDQPFYLIINLALGGTWAGKDTAQFPNGGVDQNALPASLKVQGINYYSYVGAQ